MPTTEPIRWTFEVLTEDAEVACLSVVLQALNAMLDDGDAQERVLKYLLRRLREGRP